MARVSNVELFFDLVFVYAVTQVSHLVLKAGDASAVAQTGVLLLAVWAGWIATAWTTNRFNPEQVVVRVLMFGLMALGVVVAMALPRAFADRGLAFALAYSLFQVTRSAFVLLVRHRVHDAQVTNFVRAFIWLLLAAPLWIAGGFADTDTRLVLWAIAIALEYCAPMVGFYIPGLGRSAIRDWAVEGGHLAERCSLFVLIALGESLVMSASAFETQGWTLTAFSGFATGFVALIALWWIYFDTAMERGSERIRSMEEASRMARFAYSYMHLPIIAGIILIAVANEKIIAHPGHPPDPMTAAVLIGGPVLFLLGNIAFKTSFRRPPFSHAIGLVLIGLIAWRGLAWPLEGIGLALALALALVAVWESLSLRGLIRL